MADIHTTEKKLEREIAPIDIPQRKGEPVRVDTDEFIRPGTTAATLAKLRCVFRSDGKGSVTAGNSSGLNDGAAALLVGSEAAAVSIGTTPMTRVVATAVVGVEPRCMGIGPVPATRKVLERAGLTLDQMDVIELNEAFAAQSIALGHPLGMSGARLLLTASHELIATRKRYALATMCVGVGQGMAMVLERA